MKKISSQSIQFLLAFLLSAAPASLFSPGIDATASTAQSSSKQLNLVFDLGGVLVHTNKFAAFRALGLKAVLKWKFSTKKSFSEVKQIFYQTLNHIAGNDGNQWGVKDDEGMVMPALMCDWLLGAKTTLQLRIIILRGIRNNPEWFANNHEQVLMARMTQMIFTPKIFVKTRTFSKDGFAFVKACKERGHNVYILSNWDVEAFDLMVKKYPEQFGLFDGIVTSGNAQLMKPDPKIYRLFTDVLPAESCIFFDDQKENIEAAQSVGMHAFHCVKNKSCKGPDFKAAQKLVFELEGNTPVVAQMVV